MRPLGILPALRLCVCSCAAAVSAASQQALPPAVRFALPCGANMDDGPTLAALCAHGDDVAMVETLAGPTSPFLLRATLPTPRGSLRRDAAVVPFSVRGPDGALVQTQMEVVAQHARDEDGASVVEVLALVDLPDGATRGERVRYEVVREDCAVMPFAPVADTAALWTLPGAVKLRARDLHGTVYEADLLADARSGGPTLRVLGDGPLRRIERTHEVLLPVHPASGSPPHSFGVLVHATRWSHTASVGLDLVVHDAFCGDDALDPSDDVVGDLVFDALELVVPSGWRAIARVEDPYFRQGVDDGVQSTTMIVAPLAGGAFHCLPQMSRFQRRFVLAPADETATAMALAEEQGLGFALGGQAGSRLLSWWNPDTAGYWPQRVPLPAWGAPAEATLAVELAEELRSLRGILESGTPSPGGYPVPSPVLGWAHPFGVAYGGMGGGDEVWLWDGADVAAARSVEGVLGAQLRMRMYVCRQPNSLYRRSGDPLSVDDCVAQGPSGSIMPVWWYNRPLLAQADPWGLSTADQSQREQARAAGLLAPYDAALREYQPIDYQHYVRHARSLKTLAWLANDRLAAGELEAQAESWRLAYPQLPQRPDGEAISTGFLAQRRHVDAHPGNGLAFGRGEAWGLDTLVAWHALAPASRRAVFRGFFSAVAALVADGQSSCTGSILAAPSNHDFGGQYTVRTQTETAMVEHALLGLRRSVLAGVDPCAALALDETLLRSYRSDIEWPVWRTSAPSGPLFKLAVGPFDPDAPLYCGYAPADGQSMEIDAYQSPSSLAHGHAASGDPLYLERAKELLGLADLSQLAQDPLTNWHNRLALQRRAQDLAGGR